MNPSSPCTYTYVTNNPLKYTDPSGYVFHRYERIQWEEGVSKSSGGGGGYHFDPWILNYGMDAGLRVRGPGFGVNGTGLNGVYYDWYSGTYRSTSEGNPGVSWKSVYENAIEPILTKADVFVNGNSLTLALAPTKLVSNKPLITNGNGVYLTYNRTNGRFYLPHTNTEATQSVLFADYLTRLRMSQKTSSFELLAAAIRYSPLLPGGLPNPFLGAEAIIYDVGVTGMGNEADAGVAFILAGKDKGKFARITEYAWGGGSDISLNSEWTRIDYSGNSGDFSIDLLNGFRNKAYAGYSPGGEIFSIGGAYAWNYIQDTGEKITAVSIQGSLGWNSMPFLSGGYNIGYVNARGF